MGFRCLKSGSAHLYDANRLTLNESYAITRLKLRSFAVQFLDNRDHFTGLHGDNDFRRTLDFAASLLTSHFACDAAEHATDG